MVKFGGRPPLTWKLNLSRAAACVRARGVLAGLLVAGSAGVQAVAPTPAGAAESTFGPTTVGPSAASFAANHKQVSRYTLSGGGTVTKLRVYLQPTTTVGQQVLKGVIYSDASGKLLWSSVRVPQSIAAPAMTYAIDGKQYVAVYAGGNSISAGSGTATVKYGSDLYVYALPS